MATSSRRVRPRREDRLSALPDELILVILAKLDTRTALSTAALARRWARLPRELPALEFRVSDILPPEYDRSVALRRRALPRDTASELDGHMARCEVDTMRAFAGGVTSFLDADGRRAKALRVEFFQTAHAGCVDRLIAAAVGAWGVEDLEVVARPAASCGGAAAYRLPGDDCLRRSRLRSLTLGGHCALTPPHGFGFGSLTALVLRDTPATTPAAAYEGVFRECTQLRSLRLTSCGCADRRLVVDAPRSELRELVVEECSFMSIELRDLPLLARLACRLTDTAKLGFGSLPCLTHTAIAFAEEDHRVATAKWKDRFRQFLGMSPAMTTLVVRFDGLRRWILPTAYLKRPLRHLKRLLIADLPPNWDVSWPRGLLMDAPSLELMHIHLPRSEEDPWVRNGLVWFKSLHAFRHHHLKELVMVGFTDRHVWFLKYVVSVCTSLQRLVLLNNGHVRYTGLWDWEMVGPHQACPWSQDDEMAVRRMIESGPSPHVHLILG